MQVEINGYQVVGRMPLFTAENRDKVRRGVKTQTRRVIKPQPPERFAFYAMDTATRFQWRGYSPEFEIESMWTTKCPYGKPGDIRVMPEPLIRCYDKYVCYHDDGIVYRDDDEIGAFYPWDWKRDPLSSMFMPTWAGRTLIRYTQIWVERLQDISEEDAIAEGITFVMDQHGDGFTYPGWNQKFDSAVAAYAVLWDTINSKKYPWASNPWVWCIEWELLR